MVWYTKFGLSENPFSTDPFASDYTMVNYSHIVDDLLYCVKAGSIFVIAGDQGTGKTTMLRRVITEFGGDGRVLYVDGKVYSKTLDIEAEINKQGRGFMRKIRGKKPKGLILLIDNAECLSGVNLQKLKYYFDQDYVQSIVFTTTDVQTLELSPSFHDRIAGNVCKIPVMINYDALRIVRNRFADHFFLPDDIILKLFTKSNKNIRVLLENCEKVCKFVVSKGKGEVLPKYVRLALAAPKSKKVAARSQIDMKKTVMAHE